MAEFDNRLLRVGVEVKDQIRWYEGLQISVSVTKTSNATANEATVKITNINKQTRDFILTETTPFNFNRVRKRIIIEAGRASYGYHRLFVGDICAVTPSQPPDIMLTFKAKTNEWNKGTIVSKSNAEKVKLSTIAAGIAKEMNLSLVFEATDKNVSNFYFTGAAAKQIEKLASMGRVNAYIDDANLVVKDLGKPLKEITHVLSMESGMVGIPEADEQGLKVCYLFEPSTRIGGLIELKSVLNPGLSGKYIVYTLHYELSNRDEPFYTIAEAYKEGRFLLPK